MSDGLHSDDAENSANENQAGGLEDAVAAAVLHELEDGQRVRVTSPSYEVWGTVTHLHTADEWPDEEFLTTVLTVEEADGCDKSELLLAEDENSDRLAMASLAAAFENEYVLSVEVVSNE